jgi:calcineurin-like phosphoesterase family protein
MGTYFIGCLHLGHESVARYRGFKNSEEHDKHLIESWNKCINKKDLVWILGDITMETDKHYWKLDLLNGRKKVCLGNHDKYQHSKQLMLYVEGITGAIDYKGFILTHVPIHPNEVHFYRGNIHAHIHHLNKLEEVVTKNKYNDPGSVPGFTKNKYFNVDAHLLDYTPRTIDELILRQNGS